MGPAGILLLMRTKRSDLKAVRSQNRTQSLSFKRSLAGKSLYIGVILSECKENRGNSKEHVESKNTGQKVFIDVC